MSELAGSVRFYEDKLGFEVRYCAPTEAPFFAIVGRDSVQIHLKEISDDVVPQPNHTRHEWAPWDAFVFLNDPDSLAAELTSRGVAFHRKLSDTHDGLRGFEVSDNDGYVLFFGRPR